jgi:hypothetical protein
VCHDEIGPRGLRLLTAAKTGATWPIPFHTRSALSSSSLSTSMECSLQVRGVGDLERRRMHGPVAVDDPAVTVDGQVVLVPGLRGQDDPAGTAPVKTACNAVKALRMGSLSWQGALTAAGPRTGTAAR